MAASGDAMPQRLKPLPGLVQAPGHLLVIAAKCVLPPHPQWGPWAFQERPAHRSPPAMSARSATAICDYRWPRCTWSRSPGRFHLGETGRQVMPDRLPECEPGG